MEDILRVRAMSLSAAAGMAALAAFAFMSARLYLETAPPPFDGGTITTYVEAPPPEVSPPDRRDSVIEHDVIAPLEQLVFPADPPLALAASAAMSSQSAGPVFSGENLAPTISDPHWIERPSDLSRYYPVRAVTRGVEGNAVVDCVVARSGWLTDCVVVSETPARMGFGQAAIRIARDHRMSPAMRDGVPIEARFILSTPFTLE